MDQQVNTDAARTRAQRMLDGMSVHRDLMAKEHAKMADELDRWRAGFARMQREQPAGARPPNWFDDLFDLKRRGAR